MCARADFESLREQEVWSPRWLGGDHHLDVSEQVRSFRAGMPKVMQALFQQEGVSFLQRENVNKDFPYVRTDLGNFDANLLHLLAENAAWQMVEGIGETKLRDFFNHQ